MSVADYFNWLEYSSLKNHIPNSCGHLFSKCIPNIYHITQHKSKMKNSPYKHLCHRSSEKTEFSFFPSNGEKRLHKGMVFTVSLNR